MATRSHVQPPAPVHAAAPTPPLQTPLAPRYTPAAPTLYRAHRASTPGCSQESCSKHRGESSPRTKILCKTPEKRGFHSSCAVLGLAPAAAALRETFPWCFLHKHPAAAPSFGISPCWLISPSHAGLFFLPCRCLASPRRLFPGREHGRQHLWQLRQRQPRALREMRQEVGAALAPVGATSPPPAPTAPCRPPL